MNLVKLADEYITSADRIKARVQELNATVKVLEANQMDTTPYKQRVYLLNNQYYTLIKTAQHLRNYRKVL